MAVFIQSQPQINLEGDLWLILGGPSNHLPLGDALLSVIIGKTEYLEIRIIHVDQEDKHNCRYSKLFCQTTEKANNVIINMINRKEPSPTKMVFLRPQRLNECASIKELVHDKSYVYNPT